MDPGFQRKDERLSLGKSASGHIYIELSDDTSYLNLKLQDDGRGLDLEKIKALALDHSLLTSPNPTDNDIAMLIFHPGLSTKDKVTDISGLGIGMVMLNFRFISTCPVVHGSRRRPLKNSTSIHCSMRVNTSMLAASLAKNISCQ